MPYRLLRRFSTRRVPYTTCEDWLNWEAGEEVDTFPVHVDVEDLIAWGVVEVIDRPSVGRRGREG